MENGKVIRKQSEKTYAELDGCFVFRDGRISKIDGRGGGKVVKEVKQSVRDDGYLCFVLNGKQVLSHRFIWSAFFGEIPEGMQINHIDENKQNNNIENLEMCNSCYNTNYGTGNERRAKTQSKPVNQYNIDGTLVATYPSTMEAEKKTGFNCGAISNCCRGKQKSAYGYIWKYVEKEEL